MQKESDSFHKKFASIAVIWGKFLTRVEDSVFPKVKDIMITSLAFLMFMFALVGTVPSTTARIYNDNSVKFLKENKACNYRHT